MEHPWIMLKRFDLKEFEFVLQRGTIFSIYNFHYLQERLEKKKKKLSSQMSEALKLKKFRDRKGVSIEEMLEKYLNIGGTKCLKLCKC